MDDGHGHVSNETAQILAQAASQCSLNGSLGMAGSGANGSRRVGYGTRARNGYGGNLSDYGLLNGSGHQKSWKFQSGRRHTSGEVSEETLEPPPKRARHSVPALPRSINGMISHPKSGNGSGIFHDQLEDYRHPSLHLDGSRDHENSRQSASREDPFGRNNPTPSQPQLAIEQEKLLRSLSKAHETLRDGREISLLGSPGEPSGRRSRQVSQEVRGDYELSPEPLPNVTSSAYRSTESLELENVRLRRVVQDNETELRNLRSRLEAAESERERWKAELLQANEHLRMQYTAKAMRKVSKIVDQARAEERKAYEAQLTALQKLVAQERAEKAELVEACDTYFELKGL